MGPLISLLVQRTDWRVVYRILSALLLILCVPTGLLITPEPSCTCSKNNQHIQRHSHNRKSNITPEPDEDMVEYTNGPDEIKRHQLQNVTNEDKKVSDKEKLQTLLCSVDCWLFFIGVTLCTLASTFFIINLVSFIIIPIGMD